MDHRHHFVRHRYGSFTGSRTGETIPSRFDGVKGVRPTTFTGGASRCGNAFDGSPVVFGDLLLHRPFTALAKTGDNFMAHSIEIHADREQFTPIFEP